MASGATLQYDTTANDIYQQPATFSGCGTLLATGGNQLIFGGEGGDVNVNFSPGALIDVEGNGNHARGNAGGNGNWAETPPR